MIKRCEWCGNDPLYQKYHDKEWGVPVHSDKKLFEFLILEGAQAGLSWITILKKRDAYRLAFDRFDFEKVAKYKETRIKQLLKNEGIYPNYLKMPFHSTPIFIHSVVVPLYRGQPCASSRLALNKNRRTLNSAFSSSLGIVRNQLKIRAAVTNAQAFIQIRNEFGTFNKYIWSFVDGKPRQNRFKKLRDVPAKTDISDAMAKDLKKRGFKFAGSTICYAFMQAIGMVNDHTIDCFRYKELCE